MIKRLNETKNQYLAVINFQHFHYLSYLCHEKKPSKQKQVLYIHICRLELGDIFYEYCVIMEKRLFLAKYIIGSMLI